MNPLYNSMNGNDMIKRFNDFKKNFSGDPQRKVQELLNSGRISQEQYNRAVQQAQSLRRMFGI